MTDSNRPKKKVGFVIDGMPLPYHHAGASVRLRTYDIIRSFHGDTDFTLELYRPWRTYDAVFFQKRNGWALSLAKMLHESGTKIILDVNANIFERSLYGKGFFGNLSDKYYEEVTNFAHLADRISVTSPYLESSVGSRFGSDKTVFLPENLDDRFFERSKDTPKADGTIRLVYAGYASKAQQIKLISSNLERLAARYEIRYTMICDRDPKIVIPGVTFEFLRYRNRNIHEKILLGDIFLAPRDTTDLYNLAHSFTKIGIPMSAGIPVIASPIPSYEHSPAILLDSFDNQWMDQIERLITDRNHYMTISRKGIDYCKTNFSTSAIHDNYVRFFSELL